MLREKFAVEDHGDAKAKPTSPRQDDAKVTWIFPSVQRRERVHFVELFRQRRTPPALMQGRTRTI